MKKLFSMLMVALMVFACAMPVYANEENGEKYVEVTDQDGNVTRVYKMSDEEVARRGLNVEDELPSRQPRLFSEFRQNLTRGNLYTIAQDNNWLDETVNVQFCSDSAVRYVELYIVIDGEVFDPIHFGRGNSYNFAVYWDSGDFGVVIEAIESGYAHFITQD